MQDASKDVRSLEAKPRAFLVQENPTLDYSPLREHAHWPPIVVFGQGQVTLLPQSALAHARARLQGITEDDFLVLNGDPVMIGMCVALVQELLGRVRVLRWDRREKTYLPVDIDFTGEDTTEPPIAAF